MALLRPVGRPGGGAQPSHPFPLPLNGRRRVARRAQATPSAAILGRPRPAGASKPAVVARGRPDASEATRQKQAPSTKKGVRDLGFAQPASLGQAADARGLPEPSELAHGRPSRSPEGARGRPKVRMPPPSLLSVRRGQRPAAPASLSFFGRLRAFCGQPTTCPCPQASTATGAAGEKAW